MDVQVHVDERGHDLVGVAAGVEHGLGAKLVGKIDELLESRAKDLVEVLLQLGVDLGRGVDLEWDAIGLPPIERAENSFF